MPKSKPKTLNLREAHRAIRWYQEVMGLGDWTIKASLQAGPPDWCANADDGRHAGHALARPDLKEGKVWVANARCVEGNERAEPLAALFHELLHVQCEDVGLSEHMEPAAEYMLNGLAAALLIAYRGGS